MYFNGNEVLRITYSILNLLEVLRRRKNYLLIPHHFSCVLSSV